MLLRSNPVKIASVVAVDTTGFGCLLQPSTKHSICHNELVTEVNQAPMIQEIRR
jgi:hypothetical protein